MNNGFINYLIAKQSSDLTIKCYQKIITEFLNYVNKNEEDITTVDILNYQASIANYASATVAQKLSAIKTYFNYLEKIDVISKNPASKIEIPKIKNKPKQYMTADEIRALLDATYSSRNKAIIATVISTGMRLDEMRNITMQQYEDMCMGKYGYRIIIITGKGDKERKIFINDMAKEAIDEYIAKKKTTSGYLFESYRGNKLDAANLDRMLKLTAKKAGLPYADEISMHWLRAGFATIASKQGIPVAVISEAMGHASLTTTTRYIKNSQEDINNAMNTMQF